jgi:hypothetical protein
MSPGSDEDTDYYLNSGSSDVPPHDGWISFADGIDPPPTVGRLC